MGGWGTGQPVAEGSCWNRGQLGKVGVPSLRLGTPPLKVLETYWRGAFQLGKRG